LNNIDFIYIMSYNVGKKGGPDLFIHAVPDNRGKKDGYYCSLVKSQRCKGVPKHLTVISFGFVPSERLPYLKAAFNDGNPEDIFSTAKRSQEKRSKG
jgi:hypothetical protein